MKRGVIAAPGIIHRLPRGFTMERSLSPEELRFYVLYWDQVVIPGNNLVYIGVPEETELVKAGAISRPRVQFTGRYEGDQVTSAVLGCQALVATQLMKDVNTDWVVHQFGGDILSTPGMTTGVSSLRLALASVLPVPPGAVQIADVLEFKHRKQADLRALHDCIDELYLDILRTPDRDLGARKAIADLRGQVEAIGSGKIDVSAWRKFDLGVEFALRPKEMVFGVAAGLGLAATAGWSAPLTAAAGALASLVEVKLSKTSTFGDGKNRLAYLSAAKRSGIVP